jgi:hypothetical protein
METLKEEREKSRFKDIKRRNTKVQIDWHTELDQGILKEEVSLYH